MRHMRDVLSSPVETRIRPAREQTLSHRRTPGRTHGAIPCRRTALAGWGLAGWGLALALLALLALAACATPSTVAGVPATTRATSAVQPHATQPATPVLLQVARITQRGTIAALDIQLVVTVTVANHTDAPIHLAGFLCQRSLARTSDGRLDNRAPSVVLELDDAPGHATWQSWYWISCPLGVNQPRDVQSVAAGDVYTTTLTCDMSAGYVVEGAGLRAGTPYTVRASLVVWHQGTLAQLDQPAAPSGQDVTTEASFTFS